MQQSTDRQNPTDSANFGKAVWLSLRKIKRAAKPLTSRHTFAAHFILPYRTTATRQNSAKPTNFLPTFASWKKYWHSYLVFTCWLWQLCLAATRRTVNIRVQTNLLSQRLTIQTTTATPSIAPRFVCVLVADRLLQLNFILLFLPTFHQYYHKTFLFTTPRLFLRCICLFGNSQNSVNEFLMFR